MRTKLGQIFIFSSLLILGLGLSWQVKAQTDIFFVVTGRLSTDDGNNDDVKILITKSGVEQQTFTPPRNGRFRFEFDYNNEYSMTFFKEGYYKKNIVVSTHVPQDVLKENSDFPPFQIEVLLVKEIPGIDKSFTNKPAGRVYYNANIDNFDSEVFFSDIQLEEQAANARSQEQALTEEERAALAQREADYKQSIADADAMMQSKKYPEALSKFEYAHGLFPERPYPNDRIAELRDLLSALNLAEQRQRENDKAYSDKIKEADGWLNQQAYEQALMAYEDALTLKPQDTYATAQIAKVNTLIKQEEIDMQYNKLLADASEAYASGNLQQAKEIYQQAVLVKPSETDFINAQIQKIDNELSLQNELAQKEKKYKELMEEGANALSREKYNEALVAFRQALTYKPDDSLATQRIGEVENIIVQLQNQKNYNQTIANADKEFESNSLVSAKSLYQQALTYLPNENYPKEKIAEIDQRISSNEQFAQLVAQANQAFEGQNLELAKQLFEQALAIKDDASVRNRIAEIDKELARIELENNYADLLKRADAAKTNAEYEIAKSLYSQALELKKDEPYPAQQIRAIDEELARIESQKQLDQQFNEVVAKAESEFRRNDYTAALGSFKAALVLKPDNQLVKTRIGDTEEMILQAQKKQQYDEVLANANQAFGQEQMEQAKTLYQQALAILPDEVFPQQQISLINQQVADEKARQAALAQAEQQKYDAAVQKGDNLFNVKNYEPAKLAYQEALSIKADESYPKGKISEIEGELARLASLTASYNKAIEDANRLAQQEKYELAREKYGEALQYKPEEDYPKRQIERIDEILAQIAAEKQREAEYAAAVQAGDSLLNLEQNQPAKESYQTALQLKPNESYPTQKISEINNILAELERQRIAAEVTRKAYDEAVQRADAQLADKKYAAARFSYEEALSLLPEETYPKDIIDEIARLIAQEKEQAYQADIVSGDQLFRAENYSESKSAYNNALKIKPDDAYAIGQIEKITGILEQLAKDEQAREQLDKEYSAKLKNAELAFNNTQFEDAKGWYEQANTIKPEEVYPKKQIAKIDSLLQDIQKRGEINEAYMQAIRKAQNAFNNDQLTEALNFFREAASYKPAEALPKKRIPEIEELIAQREELARLVAEEEQQRQAILQAKQKRYDAELASAQAAFENQKYAIAKDHLVEALNILPEEQFPKDRIAQIDLLIEQQKMAEMEKEQQAMQDSIAKAKQIAFDRAFGEAEQLENSGQFVESIDRFGDAKEILPSKTELVNQRIEQVRLKIRNQQELEANYTAAIQEADRLFGLEDWKMALNSYEKALSYKPEENYPQEKIRFINQRLGKLDSSYDEAIRMADQLFNNEEWTQAKVKYTAALGLKPQEKYPADQLSLIDRKLADLQLAQQEKANQQQAYDAAITEAEQSFVASQLTLAKSQFQNAKSIKPDETYPDERIAEIDRLLAQKEREKEFVLKQNQTNERYQQAIAIADREFKTKNYDQAKVYYQNALAIKPNEKYPADQLALIDELKRVEVASKTTTENQNVSSPVVKKPAVANVTSEPLVINQPQTSAMSYAEQYDEYIALADDSYKQQNYKVAQYYYQKALGEKPQETYPKERLSEISELINKTMSKNALADYESAIKQADRTFAAKQYNIAKFYYYKALEVKSWEQYPKDRIVEIEHLTNSMLDQIKEQEYQDLIAKADEAFVRQEYAISRGYYNQSLSVKTTEQYPKIKLKEISSALKDELANADNQKYLDLIAQGDKAMTATNYSIARFYYQKALGVKPNETYPKQQLNLIKESVNSVN